MKAKIEKLDKDNQYQVLLDSYQQVENAWQNSVDVGSIDVKNIANIVVSGLGGSAISGDMLRNYLGDELKISYMVNRTYNLPAFADEKTLVIISSYSGNTEETISVLKQAVEKKARVVCLTTGGEIQKIAEKENLPVVLLQKGYQPRYALYVNFFNALKVFQQLGFVDDQTALVGSIASRMKQCGEVYGSLDEPVNAALDMAQKLVQSIPVIYSVTDYTDAVGLRFKGQLNENSKMHAFHNVLPEMNHNEIIGWENYSDKNGRLTIVNIMDKDYQEPVKKRFEIIENLLKDKVAILNINGSGDDIKMRIFDIVYLCDWISYYCAILNDRDPSEIDYIHHLKNELAKRS